MKLRLPLTLRSAVLACFVLLSAVSGNGLHASTTNLGNVMYVGDSITHGYNSASYRWEMFKIFTDNGIANNMVGVTSGNNAYTGTPAGTVYGEKTYNNKHSSISSERAYEIAGRINTSGRLGGTNIKDWLGLSSYTGTYKLAANETPDTCLIMIGTNDLLSDSGYTEANFNTKINNLLGTYSGSTKTADGDMDAIVKAIIQKNSESTIYVTSVPVWTQHSNNNDSLNHQKVAEYNGKLQTWADEYAQVTYIDVNKGLIDVTSSTPIYGVRDMFHSPGSDGLHPNAQGNLIIAGNIAKGMGLAGRTAGQVRKSASFLNKSVGTTGHILNQETLTANSFSLTNATVQGNSIVFNVNNSATPASVTGTWGGAVPTQGFTAEISLQMSKVSGSAWSDANVFNMQVGNGIVSNGTLSITEAFIKWNGKVLYSTDMSLEMNDLRVAYVIGDSLNGLTGGYYVWLGDQLIGEALSGDSSTKYNGVILGNTGTGNITVKAAVNSISLDGTSSYAPSTTGAADPSNAYIASGGNTPSGTGEGTITWKTDGFTASKTDLVIDSGAYNMRNNVDATAGGSTSVINAVLASGSGSNIYVNNGNYTGDVWGTIETNGTLTAWIGGHTSNTLTGSVYMKVTGGLTTMTAFGAVNGTQVTGNIYVELSAENANYTTFTTAAGNEKVSLAGAYETNVTGNIALVVNAGTLAHSIVGGNYFTTNKTIGGSPRVYVNGGSVGGNIFAGNSRNGTIAGNASVTVTGGLVSGNIYGGNGAGTIQGNTFVEISGGTIRGNIFGGGTGGTVGGNTNVTIKNIADEAGANSFSNYTGTIDGGGGTVTGTKNLVFDSSNYSFLGTLTNFDSITATNSDMVVTTAIANTANFTVNGAGKTLTLDGGLTSAAGLTKTGNGTLILAGSNSITGNVAVNGGSLQVNGASAYGNIANVGIVAGSSLVMNLYAADNMTLNGSNLTGDGSLRVTGEQGRLVLADSMLFKGGLLIDGGRVFLDQDLRYTAADLGNIVLSDTGVLSLYQDQYNALQSKISGATIGTNLFILDAGASQIVIDPASIANIATLNSQIASATPMSKVYVTTDITLSGGSTGLNFTTYEGDIRIGDGKKLTLASNDISQASDLILVDGQGKAAMLDVTADSSINNLLSASNASADTTDLSDGNLNKGSQYGSDTSVKIADGKTLTLKGLNYGGSFTGSGSLILSGGTEMIVSSVTNKNFAGQVTLTDNASLTIGSEDAFFAKLAVNEGSALYYNGASLSGKTLSLAGKFDISGNQSGTLKMNMAGSSIASTGAFVLGGKTLLLDPGSQTPLSLVAANVTGTGIFGISSATAGSSIKLTGLGQNVSPVMTYGLYAAGGTLTVEKLKLFANLYAGDLTTDSGKIYLGEDTGFADNSLANYAAVVSKWGKGELILDLGSADRGRRFQVAEGRFVLVATGAGKNVSTSLYGSSIDGATTGYVVIDGVNFTGTSTSVVGGNRDVVATGNTGIEIINGSQISGSIIGGSLNYDGVVIGSATVPALTGNTSLIIKSVQAGGASDLSIDMTSGRNANIIVGGNVATNNNSGQTRVFNLAGNTSVVIDTTSDTAAKQFVKAIFGGSMSSWLNATSNVSGTSTVNIKANNTTTFTQFIAGGGLVNRADCHAGVVGGSNLTVDGGTYSSFIIGGGLVSNNASGNGTANMGAANGDSSFDYSTQTLTSVVINGGVINGGVVGGGYKNSTGSVAATAQAHVYGNTSVTINGGTFGAAAKIYGGGYSNTVGNSNIFGTTHLTFDDSAKKISLNDAMAIYAGSVSAVADSQLTIGKDADGISTYTTLKNIASGSSVASFAGTFHGDGGVLAGGAMLVLDNVTATLNATFSGYTHLRLAGGTNASFTQARLGAIANIDLASGTTFRYEGATLTLDNLTGGGVLALTGNSQTLNVGNTAGKNNILSGNITGTGITFNKTGSNTLSLSGDNSSLTGTLNVTGGVLSLDSTTALGGLAVNVGASGKVVLDVDPSLTMGSLAGVAAADGVTINGGAMQVATIGSIGSLVEGSILITAESQPGKLGGLFLTNGLYYNGYDLGTAMGWLQSGLIDKNSTGQLYINGTREDYNTVYEWCQANGYGSIQLAGGENVVIDTQEKLIALYDDDTDRYGLGKLDSSGQFTMQILTPVGDRNGASSSVDVIGSATFMQAGTYTGETSVASNGILNLNVKDAIATSSNVVNNGVINLSADNILNNLSGSMASAVINVQSDNGLYLNNSEDTVYAGGLVQVPADGSINKTGTGLLTVSGNVNATNLNMEDGSRMNLLGGDNNVTALDLAANSDLGIGEGGVLRLGAITGTGNVTLDSGALILTNGGILEAVVGGEGLLQVASGVLSVAGGSLDGAIDLSLSGGGINLNGTSQTIRSISGSGALDLGSNGNLALVSEGGQSARYSGNITGDGIFNNTGAGSQTLTGAIGGDVTLAQSGAGGTLIIDSATGSPAAVNGLIAGAADAVSPTPAATLILRQDTAANSMTVYSNGVVQLGDNSESGHVARLAINGPVNLHNGASLGITASGSGIENSTDTSWAYVTSTGDINLVGSGVLNVNVTGLGGISDWAGSAFDLNIMTASSGIKGLNADMSNLNFTYDGFAGLLFETSAVLANNGQTLQVNFNKRSGNPLTQYASTANQKAAAENIWTIANIRPAVTGELYDIIAQFEADLSNSSSGIAQGLSNYAGSGVTAIHSAQKEALRNHEMSIRNRVAQMGLDPAYIYDDTPVCNMWINATGANLKLDDDGDASGFKLTTWGGTFGLDCNLNEYVTIGGAFTADYGDLRAWNANGDLDTYYGNLFAKVQSGRWSHMCILTYGWSDAKLNRTVSVPGGSAYNMSGDTTGNGYSAFYEGAYTFYLAEKKDVILQPMINASISTVTTKGYTETGAGNASMQVGKIDSTYGMVGAGVRLIGETGSNLFGRAALGELRAQLVQGLGDEEVSALMNPVGIPSASFRTEGSKPGSTGVRVGGGLNIPVGQQGAVYIDLDAEFRSRISTYGGVIGYKYTF